MLFLALALLNAAGATPARAEPRAIPEPIYGVTVESVEDWRGILDSLKALPRVPTVRVVFDASLNPGAYRFQVEQLRGASYVMGQLLDSSDMRDMPAEAFSKRVDYYLAMLGQDVDVWEIGNEINGEWLGPTSETVAKVTYAYEAVKARGGKAAVTLYYNQGCAESADHEMFAWAGANLPAELRSGADYVLVSYYEEDCHGLRPDWSSVFHQLAAMFPHSKIGFGEVGAKNAKADVLARYYGLKIDEPQYVGGYFWWTFVQDMVPASKPLFAALAQAWAQGPATPALESAPGQVPAVTGTPAASSASTAGASPVSVRRHGWLWRLFHRRHGN